MSFSLRPKSVLNAICLVVLIIGFTVSANADSAKVETDSFLFELPSTWKIEDLSNQAKLVGPNDEYLTISSYRITGDGSDADLQRIRNEFGEKIVSTMIQASNEPDLELTLSLTESNTSAGLPVWEINSETLDKLHFYNLYGVVGLRVALLITLEGNIENKTSSNDVVTALRNITWY